MQAVFLFCAALAIAPDSYDARDRQRSTSLLMRLRGGDATELRPGTLDYSKWDEVLYLQHALHITITTDLARAHTRTQTRTEPEETHSRVLHSLSMSALVRKGCQR